MGNPYSRTDQDLLNDIGARIRMIRTNLGLSQEKLSFKSELDRTYIGSVERGERNVSVINLRKIAKALDVDITELFKF